MLFVVYRQAMHLGVEGILNLRRGATKFDQRSSVVHSQRRESLRIEPSLHRLQVGFGRTKLLSKFLRCQPSVKFRRIGILLIGEQLLQRCFLLRAPLQQHVHSGHWLLLGQGTAVVRGPRHRMHIATQRHQFLVLNCLDNSRLWG